jgi:hypothetical protein
MCDTAGSVKAWVFRSWWLRLLELRNAEASDEAHQLLLVLDEIGRQVDATRPYAEAPAAGRTELGSLLDPSFDWSHGEITMSREVITRVVELTGISEI